MTNTNVKEDSTKITVESITIIAGKNMSSVDRANYGVSQEGFAEMRVVKNSPRRLEVLPIKEGVKPTEGFRNAIGEAGLMGKTFD